MNGPPATGAAAPAGSPRKREALELFSELPSRYDALSAALSFWQDPRWRRALVDALAPAPGEAILDVATGTGLVAAEILARGDCSVTGVDQSEHMLRAARARFARAAIGGAPQPVQLLRAEAERLPFPDARFDAVSFTYLLRYVDDPASTIAELARVLRPGGRMASLEFGVPPLWPARWAWRAYTAVGLPLLGSLASPAWRHVGAFLGPSIRDFYRRHTLAQIAGYWEAAGMRDVGLARMSLGGGVIMWGTRGRGAVRAPAAPGQQTPDATDA